MPKYGLKDNFSITLNQDSRIDWDSIFLPIRSSKSNGLSKSDIKQVIYNNPATIVYFKDGSKVVVKTMDGDEFNEEVGLAMAIMKKTFGSSTAFKKFAKKWKEL